MVSHIAKARAAAEELKGLLVCNSIEETTKRIDKLLMIPSMNSLVTRLLRVPTTTKDDAIAVENSAMVASRGRGRSGRDKTANISSSDIPSNERTEYQEFLRLKSNNHAQSSASP
ncbi:hypothetical protein CR513_62779, partial [Mucuna pruriens]